MDTYGKEVGAAGVRTGHIPDKPDWADSDTGLWSLISWSLLLQHRIKIRQHLRRIPLLRPHQLPPNLSVSINHISLGNQRSPVTQFNLGLIVLHVRIAPSGEHNPEILQK